MLKYKFYHIVLIVIISCKNSTSSQNESSTDSNTSNTIFDKEDITNLKDTIGFFSNCKKWTNGSSMGYLQGVEASKDSLGSFCFYECYDCKETFRIIFVYNDINKRGGVNHDFVWTEFKNGCTNNFLKFQCYAFVYPMRDPDKQSDVHAMNIDFPIEVRVYERTSDDIWKFIKKVKTKNFNDYALLQFKSIYHLE